MKHVDSKSVKKELSGGLGRFWNYRPISGDTIMSSDMLNSSILVSLSPESIGVYYYT